MRPRRRPILLLALGNDILGDDGAGLAAARALREEFADEVDVVESGEAGLALLDMMAGYKCVLLLDTITTGEHSPGTVLELSREDFDKAVGPSPHYAGLPEVLELARRMDIDFPGEISILALEIEQPLDFRETLTPPIEKALPAYVERSRQILREWTTETPSDPAG
ncbi:MAG: hydrogenase maturation protease [Phycisphaerae bacterium]